MARDPQGSNPDLRPIHLPTTPGVHALGAVALEQWRRHFLNDHLPARRDCSHCVRAQGRSKPHRRVQHPEAYTLSIDLSGRMTAGTDQSAQEVKYLMVGCYTVPISRDGRSLLPVPGQEQTEQDQPLPGLDEEVEGMEVEGDEQVLPEEDEPIDEGDTRHVRSAQSMHSTWHRLVEEAQNVAVHQITFVEPVKSRAVKHVLPALARMYCRLRSLGLPVYRIHSDRAKEFCSEPVRTWTLERDILTTMTPGSSYKANGRVEGEMNTIKKSIRTLISAQLAPLKQWPLAARHIGERRLRAQLQLLGWPVGRLLRFGATAYALRKSWQARYVAWRDVREEVRVLGPDMNSSLTNTGYFVESKATGRRFYTDDIVIPEPQQPALEEQVLYLPERPAAVPLRRQRVKASTPAISMLHMEGENIITNQFSEMFEPDPSYENSSDSWTLGTTDESSASSSPRIPIDPDEDWWPGGGDVEGVPNTWDGGSRPGTPPTSQSSRAPILRRIHCNVTEYIKEEMNLVDATSTDQTLWIPTLNQAMLNRVTLENQLCAMNEATALEDKVAEEFLVTKTIGNKEVWETLPMWEESIRAEYDQLVNQKRAVVQITQQQLRERAAAAGVEIELLPGKMVHTRKAHTGAYRSRAVICGNYATPTEQDVYAGGSDSTQVRMALKTAALKDWKVMGTDIRTAFLNAKRRDDTKIVAMNIPAVFRALGLATEDEVWVVEMALYGLATSPRDWGVHRDSVLPQLVWKRKIEDGVEVTGRFEKTADDNLWRIVEKGPDHQDQWCGLLCVYVDDLLFCGEQGALSKAFQAVESKWACAPAEWASEAKALKFCGMEIMMDKNGDGIHLAQSGYEKEILERWPTEVGFDFPNFKINEADFEPVDHVEPGVLRDAQALAGGLLWLATRTRPDLAFGVSAMSRLMSKNPQKALEVGRALLGYLKATPGDLHYFKNVPNDGWGERGQLKMQRSGRSLEIFSDIAYAAGTGHRSIQALQSSLVAALWDGKAHSKHL